MTASIDALVADRAACAPGDPALVAAGTTLTYRQLDEAAVAWQCELIHCGITAGTVATVRLPREPRLVAVLLGLLRCGAAYLAADTGWTPERVVAAAERAGGPLLVDATDALVRWNGGPVIPVGLAAPAAVHRHDPLSAPDLPACVFLTSGSTGRPKAVLAPHRATVHVLTGQHYADFGPGCRMLQAAPLPWDGLTLELWGPLLNGGAAVLADAEADPAVRLRRHVRRDGVTTVWFTAAVFHALVDDDPGAFAGLRQVLSGGERLSPDHVSRFRRLHPGIRLGNGYGPCETTVFATVHDVTDDETDDGKAADAGDVPLGRPLHGVTVASPSGAATEEIVVGGGGLSYGYLGDPRATAAAFVPAPGGLRWYRTGDLGVLDSAGRLRFRGRADRQLKIRGQRLEPEEVEHLLRRTLPVAAAAVTPRRDALGAVTGVLGHVVPLATDAETTGWADRIRTARSPIPPEFRPSRLIVHTRLPVLASGKVDYAALEAAGQAVPTPVSTPPPSPELDHVLAAAHEVGLAVAPDTDLFAAGLDSLTVVRLLARLHRHRPRTLTPADVYRHSTPAALAEAWAARAAAAPGQHRDLPRAVSEMWLHEQMEPGDHAALVACAFRVGPRFERLRWENAVRTVARRHVALGTLLDLDGDRLRRMSAGEAAYDRLAAGRPWPATGDEVLQLPRGSLAPFDLAVELPWRWYLDTRTATVLLVFHHVAIDGWSEPLVLDDLGRAYRGESFAATPSPSQPTRHRPPAGSGNGHSPGRYAPPCRRPPLRCPGRQLLPCPRPGSASTARTWIGRPEAGPARPGTMRCWARSRTRCGRCPRPSRRVRSSSASPTLAVTTPQPTTSDCSSASCRSCSATGRTRPPRGWMR